MLSLYTQARWFSPSLSLVTSLLSFIPVLSLPPQHRSSSVRQLTKALLLSRKKKIRTTTFPLKTVIPSSKTLLRTAEKTHFWQKHALPWSSIYLTPSAFPPAPPQDSRAGQQGRAVPPTPAGVAAPAPARQRPPQRAPLRSVPLRSLQCHRRPSALPRGLRACRPSRLALARPTAPAARTRTHRRPPLLPQPDGSDLRPHNPAPHYLRGSGRSSARTGEQRGGGGEGGRERPLAGGGRAVWRPPGLRQKGDPWGGRRLWAWRGGVRARPKRCVTK